jgi:hypothetical protein
MLEALAMWQCPSGISISSSEIEISGLPGVSAVIIQEAQLKCGAGWRYLVAWGGTKRGVEAGRGGVAEVPVVSGRRSIKCVRTVITVI